jgi:PhnB protein
MKKIIPNLFIENCKENLDYYKSIFGGEIKNIVPYKDASGKLMHAELHINEQCILYFCDLMQPSKTDTNIHILLAFDNEEEIKKIYDGLKENANVIYELQITFWGSLHAVIEDKNGVIWELNK